MSDIQPDDIQAELAALADGTLAVERRAELSARVQESPEQCAQLELQRRAIAGIRSLEAIQAPVTLRQSIGALSSGGAQSRRRAPRLRLAAAGALAAGIAAAAAVVLSTGASNTPTVLDASSVALRPATLAAPAESPRNRGLLESSVEGVTYPYWGGQLGWRTTGARSDRLGGHAITTVFYTGRDGRRIGYAIIAGAPLPTPAGGAVVEQHGIPFHVLAAGGVTVVSWREAGHTCILASRSVAAHTLLALVGGQRT